MRIVMATALALLPGLAASETYWQPTLDVNYGQNLVKGYSTRQEAVVGIDFEHRQDAYLLKFDSRLSYDFVYRCEGRYSPADRTDYQRRLLLDDVYVAWQNNDVDFRLGWQKVAWGEADELRLVDVVNPVNYRDFILIDLDEQRQALPMAKLETALTEQVSLELLAIAGYQSNTLVPDGGELAFAPALPVSISDNNKLEFGLKLSSYLWDGDAGFYAFSGYNDDPVMLATEPQAELAYLLHRSLMLGASYSKPYDSLLFRTELARTANLAVPHQTTDYALIDKWQALLGVDYRHIDWTFTFQLAGQYLHNHQSELMVPQFEPTYTFSAERDFLSGNLIFKSAISTIPTNGGGVLSQIKSTFKYSESLHMKLNLDFMSGSSRNFIGQFSDRDRAMLSVVFYL